MQTLDRHPDADQTPVARRAALAELFAKGLLRLAVRHALPAGNLEDSGGKGLEVSAPVSVTVPTG